VERGLKVLILIELIYCDIIGAWEGVGHVNPVEKKKRKKRFPALSAGNKKLKNISRDSNRGHSITNSKIPKISSTKVNK
jgi:hypothetical protein